MEKNILMVLFVFFDYGIQSFEEGGIKMSVALKKAEMFSTLWIPQKQIFHSVKVLGM